MTDAKEKPASLEDVIGGAAKVEISADDDERGRELFGDAWPSIKATMEPGSVYALDFVPLPPAKPAT